MTGQVTDGEKKDKARVFFRIARRERRLCSSSEALRSLFSALGGEEAGSLIPLWKNWTQAMGEEIASLGVPLGHADSILHIGADDSMALQELSLQAEEIRERANAFLGKDWCTGIVVRLMQGRPDLSASRSLDSFVLPQAREDVPEIGGLLGKLDPDSPVTRCYEAFVALARKDPSHSTGSCHDALASLHSPPG